MLKNLSTFEIVFICVVSVALGVSFWGWTFIYEIAKPFLKIYGLNYLVSGLWILSAVMLSGIIQKPGVAILSSVIAATIEASFTHWGLTTALWGLVQGLGAEIIFLFFRYKKWNLMVLILASMLSAFLSYILDYFMYGYKNAALSVQITQLISFLLSSALFSGWLSYYLINRLLKVGLLNKFLIAKKNV